MLIYRYEQKSVFFSPPANICLDNDGYHADIRMVALEKIPIKTTYSRELYNGMQSRKIILRTNRFYQKNLHI